MLDAFAFVARSFLIFFAQQTKVFSYLLHHLFPRIPMSTITISEKFCATYAELAEQLPGLTVSTLKAIKRASRGSDDTPFRGRGSYPSWVKTWMKKHPEFAPGSRKLTRPCNGSGHRPAASGKSDAPSHQHARQSASPAESAPRHVPGE